MARWSRRYWREDRFSAVSPLQSSTIVKKLRCCLQCMKCTNNIETPAQMSVIDQSKPGRTDTAAMILGRLIMPKRTGLSPEAAQSILRLDFHSADKRRVDFLSAKAQEGTLTSKERAELEDYIRVADLLAMLQSKARLSLKKAGLAAEA
jgi:hypothetical protein